MAEEVEPFITREELQRKILAYRAKKTQQELANLSSFTRETFRRVVMSADEGKNECYVYVNKDVFIDADNLEPRFKRIFKGCDIQVLARLPTGVDCVKISW